MAMVYLLYLRPSTRVFIRYLSATRFTVMAAATLSLDYLYHIIAKNKI